MSNIIENPEGKRFEAVETFEDFQKAAKENLDLIRAGILDVNTSKTISLAFGVIIAGERLNILYNASRGEKPYSKFFEKHAGVKKIEGK